jgi:hypothetical protein
VTTRRVLLGAAVAVAVLVGAGIVLIVPVVRDLRAAESVLSGAPADVTNEQIITAQEHLRSAHDRLESLPARALGALPLVGANLGAVREVTAAASRVLEAGAELSRVLDHSDVAGILDDGAVNRRLLDALEAPLQEQVEALRALEGVLQERRSGSLAPPLWSALDELLYQTRGILEDAGAGLRLLQVRDGLLGRDRPRRYLVVLVNNAELRGSGGILAGVGTLEVAGGRVELGRFHSVHDLAQRPPEPVAAPAEYERRFGVYKANTTLWLNTTFSPDFPDVALVAARLFEHVTGSATDGVLQIDPVALAALLPRGTEIAVPALEERLEASELARFVYSDAYDRFEDQSRRRDALLRVGERVFEQIVAHGIGGSEGLVRVGDAVAGGHLRFASFDEEEAAALAAVGASWDLAPVEGDSLLVTAQNFGSGRRDQGTKLDYWVRRALRHSCSVRQEGPTRCATDVVLRNETPTGLTTYVAGDPYGLVRSYVEVYVPQEAELVAVQLDGSPVEFRAEGQAGRTAVGVFVEVPRGQTGSLQVAYELPERDDYSFHALPQPLAADATIDVTVELPDDWVVHGAGATERDGVNTYLGPFDRRLEITAGPSERTGLPALWEDLQDFWNDPVA